ncbi:MAG: ThiF family adenylyltransferase [Patescibacteria group bacterium]|jgi:hypothetical protein
MKNIFIKPRQLDKKTLKKELVEIKKEYPGLVVKDEYMTQLEDLFLLRNPKFRFIKEYKKDFEKFVSDYKKNQTDLSQCGNWFFFPWLSVVFHVLEEVDFFEMRTGRNCNLITKKEQKAFYEATIALAGLSVGSHAASTIVMNGGARRFKIADLDVLSGSNLNRVRTGVQNIGEDKSHLVARQLYELNPYIKLELYDEGISEKNIESFLKGADLLIEEMDNPFYKFKIREIAKIKKIPVIMATDNGDNIFIDIERYDLQPNLALFNGKAMNITSNDLKTIDPRELPRIAARIAGAEIATTRMQQSVLEVGKTLYSWPQLGTAANLCGTALAFLARNIVNGYKNYKSGRYEINLEAVLDADYAKNKNRRLKDTKKFLQIIGI